VGRAADIRLKFAVRPEDLARLRRLPPFAGSSATRQSLNGTYYDTPDLTLKRRSLALHVRREGGRYLQGLDANGPFEAAFVSVVAPDSRWPVRSPVPDLSAPELRKRLDNVGAAELSAIFRSRIRRETRVLHPSPGASVKLSVDRGAIETAAGQVLPLCELELELAEGSAVALFEVAQTLSRTGFVRLEARNGVWRGYGLLDGGGDAGDAAVQRYEAVAIDGGISVEEALATIVRRSLAHMLVNDPAALAGDAEGVHQMRVALRRLRATLSLFKWLIPEDERRHAVGEMKRVGACLGAARNWDIFLELAAPVGQAFPHDRDVEAVLAEAEKKRRAAYEAMRAALSSPRYTEMVLQLMERVETHAWRGQRVAENSVLLPSPLKEAADGLIEKRYRRARKLARRFDALDTPGRHVFRIVLKKLRYGVDSFKALYEGKPVRRYVRRVAALQNSLGLLNDIATAEQLMSELLASAGASGDLRRGVGIVHGWLGRVLAEDDRTLRRRVARLLKAKPFWPRPKKARTAAGMAVAGDDGAPGD
jgi:triphosphatase